MPQAPLKAQSTTPGTTPNRCIIPTRASNVVQYISKLHANVRCLGYAVRPQVLVCLAQQFSKKKGIVINGLLAFCSISIQKVSFH